MHWELRVHDWRDRAIHMIFVAQQTVLARFAGGMTRLAEILFYFTEIGRKNFRIALFVALQIGAVFFEVVACQTPAIFQGAEVRLMDESRKALLFPLGRGLREIDDPPLALEVVNAVALRA